MWNLIVKTVESYLKVIPVEEFVEEGPESMVALLGQLTKAVERMQQEHPGVDLTPFLHDLAAMQTLIKCADPVGANTASPEEVR